MAKNNKTVDRIQAVWNKIGGEEGVKKLLKDTTKIVIIEDVIDCDVLPYIEHDWIVEEHQQGGQFAFDPLKLEYYLSNEQQNSGLDAFIEGNKLREELSGKPVLNANVLDYLLSNPHLIPKEWRGNYNYFWGTLYRIRGGRLFVRFLFWQYNDGKSRWSCSYRWLDSDFRALDRAVLRAS
jgi:hypothetical protein